MVQEDGTAVDWTSKVFIKSSTHAVGATANTDSGMFGGDGSP